MIPAMTNTGFPAVPAPEFTDPLPGYSYVGEQCVAASYRIPDELKRRTNGAVRYAGDTGKIPGVESQTDLIRVAAHYYVAQLEQRFNNGQAFPDPGTNTHRGRGADHPGQLVKIGVHLPCHCTDESWGRHALSTTPGRYPELPARTDSLPQHSMPHSSNWNETTTAANHFTTHGVTCRKGGYRAIDREPSLRQVLPGAATRSVSPGRFRPSRPGRPHVERSCTCRCDRTDSTSHRSRAGGIRHRRWSWPHHPADRRRRGIPTLLSPRSRKGQHVGSLPGICTVRVVLMIPSPFQGSLSVRTRTDHRLAPSLGAAGVCG